METRVEALIREVKRHPCLYDKTNVDYSNKTKRADAWVQISTSVRMTENDCMGKWRNLRDRFVREFHKKPYESDSKWAYIKQMSFLKQYVGTRRNRWKSNGNLKFSLNSIEDDECTTGAPYLYENTMDDVCVDYNVIKGEEDATQPEISFQNAFTSELSDPNPLDHECTSEHETDECNSQSKRYKSTEDTYISFMERMTYIQEKWLESKNSKHYGFLQMVGEKLDQLPNTEQEDAKMLFLNYLHSKIRKRKILKFGKNL